MSLHFHIGHKPPERSLSRDQNPVGHAEDRAGEEGAVSEGSSLRVGVNCRISPWETYKCGPLTWKVCPQRDWVKGQRYNTKNSIPDLRSSYWTELCSVQDQSIDAKVALSHFYTLPIRVAMRDWAGLWCKCSNLSCSPQPKGSADGITGAQGHLSPVPFSPGTLFALEISRVGTNSVPVVLWHPRIPLSRRNLQE